jgi:hypothetical protein
LVADLESALKTADILFHLVYMTNGAESRFEKLSGAQRDAVREFLLFRLGDPNSEFVHSMIQTALREYWTERKES